MNRLKEYLTTLFTSPDTAREAVVAVIGSTVAADELMDGAMTLSPALAAKLGKTIGDFDIETAIQLSKADHVDFKSRTATGDQKKAVTRKSPLLGNHDHLRKPDKF